VVATRSLESFDDRAAASRTLPDRVHSASDSAVFEEYTFFTVFQPIIDLATGEAVGYEALTRFADGQSPEESLAAASTAGVGVELDAALAHAALASAHALPEGAWLSVNVSPGLAKQADKLAAILAEAPCPLVIEVGDTLASDVLDGPLARMPGVMIAIDDAGAGAGYESLARIEKLRPSFMKLHRGAVSGIEDDTARQMFVTTLVNFADRHGCKVIAEGVETEGERDALRAAGVHLGQGYFVGRPVPIDRMRGSVSTA
jgi:EAL domain-containing protein (putative c-di-GMP-specific phosphodiesterase class I)